MNFIVRDRFVHLQAAVFRKQLNRGIIIFASERAVHFCVIDDQATVDCYRIASLLPRPAPFLSTVTSVIGDKIRVSRV
uniref:Uncharacterized protein n=1 Tax=Romanomermis culicivorax TaxID=13658 RepID=A0A915LDM5_ROMCU